MLNVTTGTFAAWLDSARAHHAAGRFMQAEADYMRANALLPNHPLVLLSLGTLALNVGNMPAAVELLTRTAQLEPNNAFAWCNLGSPLQECGRLDDAIAALRRAVQLDPNLIPAASALLLMLQYHPAYDSAAILKESMQWNDGLVRRLVPTPYTSWQNNRDPDRKLRIGYVTPDYNNHPVGRFLLPLLANHDRSKFEVYFYAIARGQNPPDKLFVPHTTAWHDAGNLSDEALAAKIHRDQVDILVDLSMHTAGGKPLVFARKPAPLQVCYLAYPGTTGMTAIDYRFSDPHLDPPGADAFYSEKTLRLKSFWCYEGCAEAPPVGPLPASSRGHVTFGSLNNFAKVSTETLAAFGRILRAVENSRMILFCLPGQGGMRDQALKGLSATGPIDPARIEFVGRQAFTDYFATYNRIDIALDSFPFCGGTTTCDALWMGVPVVTLRGNKPVARSGVSILSNAGITGTIADTVDGYIEIARSLTDDLPALAKRRSEQRALMKNSLLMDGKTLARDVEEAYRKIWRDWTTPAP